MLNKIKALVNQPVVKQAAKEIISTAAIIVAGVAVISVVRIGSDLVVDAAKQIIDNYVRN